MILDANSFSDFLNSKNQDMFPVRNWIERKNGKIAYSPTDKLKEELERNQKMKRQMETYGRSNKLKQIDKNEVEEKERKLTDLESNDEHIIALATVGQVKLLISKDEKLEKDFKAKIKNGKIYKKVRHKNLLRKDSCP